MTVEEVIVEISAGVRVGAAGVAAGNHGAFESSLSFLEIKLSRLFGHKRGGPFHRPSKKPLDC